MPNLQTFKLAHTCGLFKEVIREIPGYDKPDSTYHPKALIDYNKSKDNYVIKINDCMLDMPAKNQSAGIKKLIESKSNRAVRKDAVTCNIIVTLPRNLDNDIDEFFRESYKALLIICGIKDDDVLYAVVHKDESQYHMHLSFIPTAYCRDYDKKREEWEQAKETAKANGTKVPAKPYKLKGDTNRKIEANENPIGVNCGRFTKGFLKNLNRNLEQRIAEQGIVCNISNKSKRKFDPQQMLQEQREESVKLNRSVSDLTNQENQLKERNRKLKEIGEAQKELAEQIKTDSSVYINPFLNALEELEDAILLLESNSNPTEIADSLREIIDHIHIDLGITKSLADSIPDIKDEYER